MSVVKETSDMTREDRQRVVLRFLSETGLALKPRTIYRNLRLHENITFGSESVKNYLQELADEGYVRRIDPKQLDERKLVDLEPGEGRAAYIITEKGRDFLQS